MLRRRDILVVLALVATMGVLGCWGDEKASGPVTPSIDTVPPAAVTELVADVDLGVNPSIVLSWKAGAELDLAGYHVFRTVLAGDEEPAARGKRGQTQIDSRRMATVTSPGFTDASAEWRASYVYSVSAFDQSGNESPMVSTHRIVVRTPAGERGDDHFSE
ncbi:MAG: hypothetical protein JSW67_09640 [Candidatus Latescibacterota bacterium]|nr:MAG: hypothetical protein JSW67_09640 [Candidatus Latescibacterota bacterium]